MNNEQKLAAEHEGGPLLVIAGPGTGKTTTLVGRYKYLLDSNIKTNQILCCTFSRKAADELKLRINSQTTSNDKSMFIGTFHALALRILKSIGTDIGFGKELKIWSKDYERLSVIEDIQKKENIEEYFETLESEDAKPAAVLAYIDSVREELLDPEDASIRASEKGDKAELAYCEVYREYDQYLEEQDKLDFPRMVQMAVKALEHNAANGGSYLRKFKHVLVDEFQDINAAQKCMIDYFVSANSHLWAVGDDYQAIYGWRGSNVRYMLDFKNSYKDATVHALKVNYRSGRHILQAAENLSNHFLEGFRKKLTPNTEETGKIIYDELDNEKDEAQAVVEEIQVRLDEGIPVDQIAVLSRTNKRPVKIASRLLENGIPVDLKGGVIAFESFYERQLIQAASVASGVFLELKWPRIPKDLFGFSKRLEPETWDRKIKALTTYITKRLSGSDAEENKLRLENLRTTLLSFSGADDFFSVLDATLNPNSHAQKVFIGTIHSAKGLEWDSVFVVGMEDGNLPQRQTTSPKVYDEERRIGYVAITRAKRFLFLTSIQKKGQEDCQQSPFLNEMFGSQETAQQEPTLKKQQTTVVATKLTDEERAKFAKDKWKAYQERLIERNVAARKLASTNIADGEGESLSTWDSTSTGPGFLQDAGYTTRKDGPSETFRQNILKEVFLGQQQMPDWLSETVSLQWGAPQSVERFNKIRSTINVCLGTQKGKQNPSLQAIKKWEEDLVYMDNNLRELVNN